MKPKFCLPIIAENKKEVLRIIKNNIHNFDYFEVWFAHVKNIDNQFIKQLIDLLTDKLIIVLRRNDSKRTELSFTRRCQIINLLHDKTCMIDLDIRKQKKELLFIENNKLNISLICSYHNFNETESRTKLLNIIKSMESFNPKILKLATFCQKEEAALRLMEILLKLKRERKKCIILGIGNLGKITRVFGTLWGNEMIFAPIQIGEKTADGQLTRKELDTIFRSLS